MMHLAAFTLCLTGFAALAVAMRRHQRDFFGRSLALTATRLLRIVGAGALVSALVILVMNCGWSLGLVMFSGHTSLAAGVVLCALTGYVRMHARRILKS